MDSVRGWFVIGLCSFWVRFGLGVGDSFQSVQGQCGSGLGWASGFLGWARGSSGIGLGSVQAWFGVGLVLIWHWSTMLPDITYALIGAHQSGK